MDNSRLLAAAGFTRLRFLSVCLFIASITLWSTTPRAD
jgi:hypothetical protein